MELVFSTVKEILGKYIWVLNLALLATLALWANVHTAYAQQRSNLPGFTVPKGDAAPPMPILNLSPESFANYETAFLKLRNKTLSDTLILQYQISLLKILIQRQGEIDKIAGSFGKLNIKFNQPAPEKTICHRLPENLLCMLFYPALFGIDVEAYTNPQPAVDMSLFPSPTPVQNIAEAPVTPSEDNTAPKQAEEPEEEKITTPYFWSDIQCAVSVCKVVLVDSRNPNRFITARSGQKLPDDSIVAEISYNGVKVNKEGELLRVEPAPVNGGMRPNTDPEPEMIGNILQEAGIGTQTDEPVPTKQTALTEETDSSEALFDSVPAPADSEEEFTSTNAPTPNDEPETLGPTGLF